MRLFIAEKPSLGKAIAAVLPGPQKRGETYIESGEANVVVWCAGHILLQCLPEDYDAAYKTWQLGHLPLVPDNWQLKIAPRTRDLYETIKRYIPQADLIVHAGDPDREGQLLVDDVLEQIGVDVPVKRLLIRDLNAQAVRRAMKKLEDNEHYHGMRDAARGRARADWLFGLNLTRLYTLLGRDAGYDGVLSVGRVQTPILGLVVRRDQEIEDFESKPFYTLVADIDAAPDQFAAHWVPGDDASDYQDEAGRVIDKAFTQALADSLTPANSTVADYQTQEKSERAPLPFSLPELQKVAARDRGLSPRKTLDVAQSLYEKHQVLTYPRSDSQYLPVEHWMDAAQVRDAIVQSIGEGHTLVGMTDAVDLILRSRCWDDSRVTAHHAIIPTTRWVPLDKLTADERWIYEAVAHRYLLQFAEPRRYEQTEIVLSLEKVAGGTEIFKARSRREIDPGWRTWDTIGHPAAGNPPEDQAEQDEAVNTSLPCLGVGEAVQATQCRLVEKQTTPPKRFTEATLLDAMTHIARFVQDPAIKQLLNDTDGLGTPATQAGIIDLLFKRGYLDRRKKQVFSTALGRQLITILPEPVTLPDMTARWEQQLAAVEHGDLALERFMSGVSQSTRSLVEAGKALGTLTLEGVAPSQGKGTKEAAPVHDCPGENCDGRLRRIKSSKAFFWGCTNFKAGCKETRPDSKGKPGWKVKTKHRAAAGPRKVSPAALVGETCPECKRGTIVLKALKTGKNAGKSFKGCTRFPGCRYFAWEGVDAQEAAQA